MRNGSAKYRVVYGIRQAGAIGIDTPHTVDVYADDDLGALEACRLAILEEFGGYDKVDICTPRSVTRLHDKPEKIFHQLHYAGEVAKFADGTYRLSAHRDARKFKTKDAAIQAAHERLEELS